MRWIRALLWLICLAAVVAVVWGFHPTESTNTAVVVGLAALIAGFLSDE